MDTSVYHTKKKSLVVREEADDRSNTPPTDSEDSCTSNPAKKKKLKINERLRRPASFLPAYLMPYVEHSHGDFFVSTHFSPILISQLMAEGFLPIATPRYLVPKLHKQRMVIYPLIDPKTGKIRVHTGKSTKKKCKKFSLTLQKDFNGVIEGCHRQHGVGWLYPPIVHAFAKLHRATCENNGVMVRLGSDGESVTLRLITVEVWNEKHELVGGEIGYSIGTMYTSLSGFACEDSAGSVQLAALGNLLAQQHFDLWDLGMGLDYKTRLGAEEMERPTFVETVHMLRGKEQPPLACESKNEYGMNCKDILAHTEEM
jgi:Leu/Phe-tRNA-protein transferase